VPARTIASSSAAIAALAARRRAAILRDLILARGRAMASIFKTLASFFGGGPSAPAALGPEASVEYNGFVIRAEPYKEEGQYQTAGVIAKEIGGVMKEHRFVRADRYASLDDAITFTLAKGRQIVDEQARLGPTARSLFDR
jgi:hypothetical protein